MKKVGTTFAIAILVLQVVMIVRARTNPDRYYSWAPFDQMHHYRMVVEVNGRVLSHRQVPRRYHKRAGGIEPRAIEHLFDIVRGYERLHGQDDDTHVVVTYTKNGGPEQTWEWKTP